MYRIKGNNLGIFSFRGCKVLLKNRRDYICNRQLMNKFFCSKPDKSDEPEQSEKIENLHKIKSNKNFLKSTLHSQLDKIIPGSIPIEFTYKNLVQKIEDVEEHLIGDNLIVKNLPDPNSFGEAVIYYSPNSLCAHFIKARVEFVSIPLFACLTFLSYHGILFPSLFLPYYFAALSLNSFWRFQIIKRDTKTKLIYQINLLNEHQIKIIFADGQTRVCEIKDVTLEEFTEINKMLSEESKETEKMRMANRNVFLKVNLEDGKTGVLVFRLHNIDICSAELDLLLGILSKKTHRLSI